MAVNDEIIDDQRCIGMVMVNKISTTASPTVGSEVTHSNLISITVKRAEIIRGDLSYSRFYGKELLLRLHMSPLQFAEAIMSPGVGDGVPCTLEYVKGEERIPRFEPDVTERQRLNKEFEDKILTVADDIDVFQQRILELSAKPKLSKADAIEMQQAIGKVSRLLRDSLPFMADTFGKHMDKVTNEAKGVIESFYDAKIHQLGLGALQQQSQASLMGQGNLEIPQISKL